MEFLQMGFIEKAFVGARGDLSNCDSFNHGEFQQTIHEVIKNKFSKSFRFWFWN